MKRRPPDLRRQAVLLRKNRDRKQTIYYLDCRLIGAMNQFSRPRRNGYDSDDWDDETQSPRRYFPDTYLDSPILETTRTRWLAAFAQPSIAKSSRDNQFRNTFNELQHHIKDWTTFQLVEPDQYPEIYSSPWPSTLGSSLSESWDLSKRMFREMSGAMMKKFGTSPVPLPNAFSGEATDLFHKWSFWDSLVEYYSKECSMRGSNVVRITLRDSSSPGILAEVVATKDIWFIKCDLGKYLLTYEQVLMIKDVFFTRAQCLMAVTVFYNNDSEMARAVIRTFEWHELCLTRWGNEGFEILKQSEALSKAYMSAMTDEIFGDDGPYPRMVQKVRDKEEKIYKAAYPMAEKTWQQLNAPYLADVFDDVLKEIKSIQTVVEVFGLLKVSGHPLVDPARGGLSAAAEARTDDTTLYEDAHKLNWRFKATMLRSYVSQRGWPQLEFSPEAKGTKLLECYHMQLKHLHRHSYPLSDWKHCRWTKIVDFDYSPNYLDLVDDKSISYYRSKVAATWDRDVDAGSHRRLLIELIGREEIDIKAIVKIVATRRVPFDWLIVSLCPKEREFKLAPRMFSMLVLEIRMFFALTEANLADRIFPFLPQQTMTMNKVQIGKRFLEMTKPNKSSSTLRLYLEIDLSRWNLRWRAAAVNPVARTLNDMFGEPGIFDYCHEFFSAAMIVVRVAGLRPDGIDRKNPPESPLLWYNHKGGFEGICQKLWTICTYEMIEEAIGDLPLSYILTGQGDNQVLSIEVNRVRGETDKETLSGLRDIITARIEKVCSSVNQEVKPEECLESTSVVTYSKTIYTDGVHRSTSIKAHSRLFPHSSQIFPSVRTNVGTIFSTAVAGAENSDKPLYSYFLACLYSSLYLYRVSEGRGAYGNQLSSLIKDIIRKQGSYSRESDIDLAQPSHSENRMMFIRFCISLPSELGGFPIIPPLGFLYKGGSDPLGKSLSSMVMMAHDSSSRLDNRMLAQLDDDKIFNPSPQLSTLIKDPFSICVSKPPTSVDGVSKETADAIASWDGMRLKHVHELMTQDTQDYGQTLVDHLSRCEPFVPIVFRDIMDCSVEGIRETIAGMFVTTRTLQSMVRGMNVPIVENILYLEAAGLVYMKNRYLLLPSDSAKRRSVFQLANMLRDRWFPGKKSPIEGVTTHQPIDFDYRWGAEHFGTEGINIILSTDEDPTETRGNFDPYVGSATREKRSHHGFKISGTDASSRAIRKIQLVNSQTGDDPMFRTLMDAVAWTRTSVQLSTISDRLDSASGGISYHRYAARAGHQEAFNMGSPNFATHLLISTDDTGKLAGGVNDYAFMFQEFMLQGQALLLLQHQLTGSRHLSLTIVTEGAPVEPLPNVTIRGPDEIDLRIPRFVNNPLVFIKSLDVRRISGVVAHTGITVTDDFKPTSRLRIHILESFFREQLRKQGISRQLADDSTRHFQSQTMDIAEVASNGLTNIVTAIRNVALDVAITDVMISRLSRRKRWHISVYISKILPFMVRAISPALGHPMLMNDYLVRKALLYDGPSYQGGSRLAHDRLVGIIRAECESALRGKLSNYSHRTIGIFTSDNTRVTSEAVLSCLLSDFYMWTRTKVLPGTSIHDELGPGFLPSIRGLHMEEDKVDSLFAKVLRLADRYELSYPLVSEVLRRYDKMRIYSYPSSTAEMMKMTRSPDWVVVQPPVKLHTLKLPTCLPRPRAIRGIHYDTYVRATRTLARSENDRLDVLMAVYWRNKSRTTLATGAALPVWSPFAPLFLNKPVIVIGVGNGAVARVALDGGASRVFGLDLRSSTPMKAHRFKFYKPPLVNSSQHESNYTTVPETITTSGDWMDSQICSAISKYSTSETVLVIDIESGADRYGIELLENCRLWKNIGIVVLRVFLNEIESEEMICDLTASGAKFSWYDVDNMSETSGRIIVLSRLPTEIVTAKRCKVISTRSPPLMSPPDPRSEFRGLAYSNALFNTVTTYDSILTSEIRESLVNMIEATATDYTARFSYEHWTRYLRALKVVSWIELPEPERLEDLRRMLETRRSTVTINKKVYSMDVDYMFCRHLAGVASCLVE